MHIFKIMPLLKICDGYAAMLYSEPFRDVCRETTPKRGSKNVFILGFISAKSDTVVILHPGQLSPKTFTGMPASGHL
jgi:hypothetical protein